MPEKTVEPWRMRDVPDRRGEARRAMTAWLRCVAGASQVLDGKDRVQGLVRRMLERGVDARVRVEQVLVVLGEEDGGGKSGLLARKARWKHGCGNRDD